MSAEPFNTEESVRRWTGWVLLGYAFLIAIIGLARMPPAGDLLPSTVVFTAWAVCYGVLVAAGLDRLYDTGGLRPLPGVRGDGA